MVYVVAKEESSLVSVELLTRGLLIHFEHSLDSLTFPNNGSFKYQAIVDEKYMRDGGSLSRGSHTFEGPVLDSLVQ